MIEVSKPDPTEKDSELIRQVGVWRHNRLLYPGWLVAPKETRDHIWIFSNRWAETIYSARERWPAENLLVLYREYFWRLDVSLQYAPDELADSAYDVLNHLRSLVGKSVPQAWSDLVGWPANMVFTTESLKEYWVAVACHVLRHYRINRNKTKFDKLRRDILEVAGSDDDVNARLAFDVCVWSLSENDREACLSALNDWPTGPADPYWQVKRGALFAELGEVDKARSLIERALVSIRSMQKVGIANISAMSRESWTLQHLWQIGLVREPTERAANDAEMRKRRDRQRELEAYRCSAEIEMRLLKSAIEGRPKPEILDGRREQDPDFDNGFRRQVTHWSREHPEESLAPALNVLMLVERTGLPPLLRHRSSGIGVNFFSNAYQESLEWVKDDFSGVWASWAPRFDFGGLGRGELNRQTILGLPESSVTALFVMACENLSLRFNKSQLEFHEFVGLSNQVQLATRLAICRDEQSREWLLTIFLAAIKHQKCADHPAAADQLNAILRRSIPFLTDSTVGMWLGELLDSRLPPIKESRVWQEPLNLVDEDVLDSLAERRMSNANGSDPVHLPDVTRAINRLIDLVENAEIAERCSALIRLIPLYKSGFLTKTESDQIARGLWGRVGDDGIPIILDDFYKTLLLELPEIHPGQAGAAIFDWLDAQEVSSRFTFTEFDGETKRSLSSADADRFIPNLQAVTTQLKHQGSLRDYMTENRAHAYISKLLNWWEAEADLFKKEKRNPLVAVAIDPMDRVPKILDVLGLALLLPIQHDRKILQKTFHMVDGFGQFETFRVRTAPVLAFLDKQNAERYLQVLQIALSSDDPNENRSALVALHQWGRDQEQLDLPRLTSTALSPAFFIIQSLLPPGALPAFQVLRGLIEVGAITPNCEGSDLFCASVEVACQKLSYNKLNNETSRNIDPEELPHLRRQMALMIGQMKAAGFDLNAETTTWLVEATEDEFVDVRHAAQKAERVISGGTPRSIELSE